MNLENSTISFLKNCCINNTVSNSGVFIRRNGTMEWNGGMEQWNGMEWNDHAHRTPYDDLYPLFFATFNQVAKLVVSEVLKKTGSIWSNRETREVWLEINPKVGAPGFQVQWWVMHLSMYCSGTTPLAKGGDLTCIWNQFPLHHEQLLGSNAPLRTAHFCPIICKYWSNPQAPDPQHV